MVELVGQKLHLEAYSKEEVLRILGVTAEELLTTSLSVNTTHSMSHFIDSPSDLCYKN